MGRLILIVVFGMAFYVPALPYLQPAWLAGVEFWNAYVVPFQEWVTPLREWWLRLFQIW